MSPRGSVRLVPALGALTVALALAFAILNLINVPTIQATDVGESALMLAVATTGTLLGGLIVRRTGNPIGWIFLVMAFAVALSAMSESYVLAAFRPRPRPLPMVEVVAWLGAIATPFIAAPVPALLLLFPTGRPRSERWRWAIRLWWVGVVSAAVWAALEPGHYGNPPAEGFPGIDVDKPLELLPEPIAAILATVAIVTLVGAGLLGVGSVILRYRSSAGDERQQLRWLTFVASLVVLLLVAMLAFELAGVDLGENPVLEDALWVAFVLLTITGFPAAVAVAVLRYRLYEIDVVIRKTLVSAILAGFIAAVYIGIVVGIGNAIGRGDQPNVALQVGATAVAAILFQPVRDRANRLANRLVYGRRATPYEVLADFSDRVGETYADDDVLPRMARVVAEGIAAARADVWIRMEQRLRVAASWPSEPEARAAVVLEGGALPPLPGADAAFPIEHRGEILGALAVAMPATEPMDEPKRRLVTDLAGQAGLVLRNVRLTEQLRARLDDLKAAQKRLVTAQDLERRRIERNIHDGAQQQLVALAVKLRLADTMVGRDDGKAHSMLSALQAETADALENLRDLARGIYPPLLADQGLPAALEAQARKSPVPVRLSPDGVGRYPQEVEAAVYFCVLEALQNVAKYADATSVTVALQRSEDDLTFEIVDDGRGFDAAASKGSGLTNMRDRIEALGGSLEVRSTPGRGTVVVGRVPGRGIEP